MNWVVNWVVITGSFMTGFKVYGPFTPSKTAEDWAKAEVKAGSFNNFELAPVNHPWPQKEDR